MSTNERASPAQSVHDMIAAKPLPESRDVLVMITAKPLPERLEAYWDLCRVVGGSREPGE